METSIFPARASLVALRLSRSSRLAAWMAATCSAIRSLNARYSGEGEGSVIVDDLRSFGYTLRGILPSVPCGGNGSKEEHEFYGRTLEEGLAWCLVWLMAPEIGAGPFRVRSSGRFVTRVRHHGGLARIGRGGTAREPRGVASRLGMDWSSVTASRTAKCDHPSLCDVPT